MTHFFVRSHMGKIFAVTLRSHNRATIVNESGLATRGDWTYLQSLLTGAYLRSNYRC